MRIIAWLIHTFLDPLGMGLGVVFGLITRRIWQAAVVGALLGAAAALIAGYLHQMPVEERPIVTGAIVCGTWAWLAFWLRRWLHASK